LSPEKGHLILLNALRMLLDDGVQADLQIIGAGPFEAAIRHESTRLGLDDRVTFSGELLPADVARALADADVFCLPSFSEGLPVSVMEAMAIGVPVVSTWISGIPELAVNDVTALTVPASNVEALAKALKKVAVDGKLRTALARNARTEVERMHNIAANSEKLLFLFQSVLNEVGVTGSPYTTSSIQ
jgi:glycosyltransferase involved in cell wall biosynthesis